MVYSAWAFMRQSLVKIYLAGAWCLSKISNGKYPKSYFAGRSGIEKVGSSVKILSKTDYSADIAKINPDGSISDEAFTIISSTDFHYDTDHEFNKKTTEMFFRHIKDVKPDLVVLTGDIVLSKYQQIDAIQFAKMMEKIGVYWTIVFGNHEVREEKGFYKYLMMKSFSDYPHCLAMHGPKNLYGYGNYVINIKGSKNNIRQSLFFLDSGRDIRDEYRAQYPDLPPEARGYDFIKKEQIEFYKSTVDSLKEKYGNFGSMLYFHIPVPEFAVAFEGENGKEFTQTGNARVLYGRQFESVGCSQYNSGLFDAALEKGATAIFCGHDHNNDWCAEYKGVRLVYSLPQTYNSYHIGTKFDFPEAEWNQGVTLTVIRSDGAVDISPRYNKIYL